MATSDYCEDYSFILDKFGDNNVKQKFEYLSELVLQALKTLGIEEQTSLNVSSLRMVVQCYYTDISRLKNFASIDKINVPKILSYTSFWFCRLHPINIIDHNMDENFINERVIAYITILELCNHMKINQKENCAFGKILETCNLLLYNLKYRMYTPQSLELLFTALLDCSTMDFEKEIYLCK